MVSFFPASCPRLLRVLQSNFRRTIKLYLRFRRFLISLLRPLNGVRTIILREYGTRVNAKHRKYTFLIRSNVTTNRLTRAKSVLVGTLTGLFNRPSNLLNGNRLLIRNFRFLIRLFLHNLTLFTKYYLRDNFNFFPLNLRILFRYNLGLYGKTIIHRFYIVLHRGPLMLIRLTTVRPSGNIRILRLPITPLILNTIRRNVVITNISRRCNIRRVFQFTLVRGPRQAKRAFNMRRIITRTRRRIRVTNLSGFFASTLIFTLAINDEKHRRGAHATVLIRMKMRVKRPRVVYITSFLNLIRTKRTGKRPPNALHQLQLSLVRIGQQVYRRVITTTIRIINVIVRNVNFVTKLSRTNRAVRDRVRRTRLYIMLRLFLSMGHRNIINSRTHVICGITNLRGRATTTTDQIRRGTINELRRVSGRLRRQFQHGRRTIVLYRVLNGLVRGMLMSATSRVTTRVIRHVVIRSSRRFPRRFVQRSNMILQRGTLRLLTLLLRRFRNIIRRFTRAIREVTLSTNRPLLQSINKRVSWMVMLHLLKRGRYTLFNGITLFRQRRPTATRKAIFRSLLLCRFRTTMHVPRGGRSRCQRAMLIQNRFETYARRVYQLPRIDFRFFSIRVVYRRKIPPII